MKAAHLFLITGLCLGTSGCWFGGKKTAAALPAPPPAPQPAAAQRPAPPLPPLPVPATPAEPPPPPELPVVQTPSPIPVPQIKVPPPKQTVRRKPSPMPPAAPAPATAPPVAAPAPELQEIISGNQRRQYEAEFAQDTGRANTALRVAAGRPLTAEQQETAARIRTFLAQANAARDSDISTALQLARRADLLGQELLKTMK